MKEEAPAAATATSTSTTTTTNTQQTSKVNLLKFSYLFIKSKFLFI